MIDLEIRDAKPWHCGIMARNLRASQRAFLKSLGVNAHRDLRMVFDESCIRRAMFLDGRLAALGGLTGGLADAGGNVWCAVSEWGAAHPVPVARAVLREFHHVIRHRWRVQTILPMGDPVAARYAAFAGFRFPDAPTLSWRETVARMPERAETFDGLEAVRVRYEEAA